MSSLAHCFEKFGIHPLERTEIRKAAKEYRNEGFVAQDANEKAVSDYLKSIEENHSGMVDQIRAELTKRGAFKEPPKKTLEAIGGAKKTEEVPKPESEKPVAEVKTELSPTAKDQFALSGIKQGLEMKGAKEGATPTLEGTPLMEQAIKAEKASVQPKLAFKENIPETPEFDIALWFNEHGKILTRRNPKTGRLESPGIDMTALSRREGATKAWGKYSPFAKAGSGKGQTFDVLFQELQAEGYTGTIDDALTQLEGRLTKGKGKPLSWEKMNATQREEFAREQEVAYWEDRKAIFDSDPNFLKDETFDSLTNNIDDEIMGWKEEQRAKGIPEEDITRGLEEATKTYQAEGRPPDLEAIKKALTESETSPIIKEPAPETPGDWSKGESRPFAFDPNSTENQGRFRLRDPNDFDKMGMGKSTLITRHKKNGIQDIGIDFIVGKINGKEEVQSIRFNKNLNLWPEDKATQWWEENKGSFQFSDVPTVSHEIPPAEIVKPTEDLQPSVKGKEGVPKEKTIDEIVEEDYQKAMAGSEGRIKQNMMNKARKELDVGNITQEKYDEIAKKYGPETPRAEFGKTEPIISDFGKKIGGARKDLWKERGLSLEDVKDMTLQERETYTKKAHVWPTTPYETYVNDGMSPGMTLLVKKIKDSIAITPEIPRTAQSDPKLREENFKRYIELVSAIREKLPKVRTLEDIKNLRDELFPVESQGTFHSKYTDQANKDLLLLGGRSLSSALQPSKYDLSQAEGKAEKTGFPAKQEAWQKQYAVRFDKAGDKVYRDGKEIVLDKDEWFVTKKDKHYIEQSDFSTREEAEAWAKDQTKSKGEHLTRPFRENIERTGPDYRKGKNKTGDEILSEFGFRGGEFGNWTNQSDRQQALNEAYDGLMDLADTLKIPPKALSLNGELGIAFGARGGGSASAHYEPGRVVINLTKTRGAGSLAHEWAHAVDDYFGRMANKGLPGKYVSHGTSKAGEARKEMLDAWGDVMKSISERVANKESNVAMEEKGVKQMTSYINSWFKPIDAFIKENPKANTDAVKDILSMLKGEKSKQWNGENVGPRELAEYLRGELTKSGYKISKEDAGHIGNNAWHLEKAQVDLAKAEAGELVRTERTDFFKNAMARGKGRGNNYWQRKHELFARAFESFVEDELNNTGNKSDYLVHSTKESPTSPWGAIYPQGKDRIAIDNAFKKWKESLKTKGEGGKMLYATIPLALPFLVGKGEEDRKKVYPHPSYFPPGLGIQ